MKRNQTLIENIFLKIYSSNNVYGNIIVYGNHIVGIILKNKLLNNFFNLK